MRKIEPELITGMGYIGDNPGVLYRMGGAGEQTVVTGNPALLEGVKGSRLTALAIYGKSTQGSTTGAQLYSTMPTEVKLINGITFGIKDGGLSLKGTAEGAQRNDDYFFKKGIDLSPGTYTISFSGKGNLSEIEVGISGDDKNMLLSTFALYNAPQKLTLSEAKTCYVVAQSRVGKSVDCTIYIMLNEGSTAKPYEPYTGGAPSPSPSYPQEIESAGGNGSIEVDVNGANLLDLTDMQIISPPGILVTNNGDGSFTFDGTALESKKIHVFQGANIQLPAGDYTLSFKSSSESQNNKNTYARMYFSGGITNSILNKTNGHFTMENNFIVESLLINLEEGVTFSNEKIYIMLNIGSSALPYEPYKPAQKLIIPTPGGLPGIPVSSGGNYTDKDGQQWVADEIDIARGERVQWIENLDLKKAKWLMTNRTPNAGGIYFASKIQKPVLHKLSVQGTISNIGICKNPYTDVGDYVWALSNVEISEIRIGFADSTIDSLEKLKNLLDGLPEAYAMYCLAEPIRTPLPPETIAAYKALRTYSPTTTVINDAGAGMSVGYKRK